MIGTQNVINGTRFVAGLVEKAISDERMAHYQYWLGSVLVSDRYEEVVLQFVEHSGLEYDHATELATWLLQVPRQGKIPMSLNEILARGHCGYTAPVMNDPRSRILDNLKGERCAVEFYSKFLLDISEKEYYGSKLPEVLEWVIGEETTHVADLEKLLKHY